MNIRKCDSALVRKSQLPFKFRDVHALIWDTQNVTALRHVSAPATQRARSSATTSCLMQCNRTSLTLPMGSPASCTTSGSQLAVIATRMMANPRPGLRTSSYNKLEWSCPAAHREAGPRLLGLVLPGSHLADSNLQKAVPMTSCSHILCHCCFSYLVAMKHELQGPDPQKLCTLHR